MSTLPIVIAVIKSKNGQRCEAMCGTFIPKGGFGARLAGGGVDGTVVCRECSSEFPWSPDLTKDRQVTFRNFIPEIPNTLNLDALAPEGFQKAIRLGGDYIQWAYWLGHYHGRRLPRDGSADDHPLRYG